MSFVFDPHPFTELEHFSEKTQSQLFEALVVNPYVLLLLRVEVRNDVLALVLVTGWFRIVAQKGFHVLHCSFKVHLPLVFATSLRRLVSQVVMHEHLRSLKSVFGQVTAHSLKQVLELLCWLDLLEYLPEVLFIFVSKSLVVRVFRVSSSEWLELHGHEEQSGCCCEYICFDSIVPPLLLCRSPVLLGSFALALLYFPQLWSVVGL